MLRRLLFGALCLAPTSVGASGFPLTIEDQWIFPVGIEQGVAFTGDSGPAYVLGMEASAVYLFDGLAWAGVVISAREDFAMDPTLFAIGGELGWAAFGFEAMAELQGGEVGGRFRFVFPVGLGAPFVGWRSADGVRWEAGLLLKFPLGLE